MEKNKSDSLNSLQESGDFDLDLKVQEITNVSGQTKLTNMPVKSTENNLEIKNSSKVISLKSKPQIYPLMTLSAVASLVKVFPLLENVKVFKTLQGELFSLKSSESLEIKDQNTYSLKMLKDFFLTTQEGHSGLYCFHWMNLGMMRNGLSQTLNITYRKTGKGSLSSVLEDKVDEKYYLDEKKWKEIQDHKKRHKEQGHGFGFVLKNKTECASTLTTTEIGLNTNLISKNTIQENKPFLIHNVYGGFGEKKPRIFENESPTIRTPKGGGHLPEVVKNQRIRRLTPIECERLQGFPDDWTIKGDKDKISDTQRYKMCGNAVSIPVIKAIGIKILKFIGNKNANL